MLTQTHHRRPPQYHTSFIGRRRELRAIEEALAPGKVVSLVGPGGVGKTRLASEGVRRLRACFIDLTPARTQGEAAAVVLQTLGSRERPAPEQDSVAQAAAALGEVPADVVMLDNLEQLASASSFVQRLRGEGPERCWLVTSRNPLGADERQIEIEPFEVTGEAREAVDLFLRVAAGGASELHTQRSRLAKLVTALDGLPLAIELCAARTAMLSLDEIERRIRDPLRLLVDPSRPEDKGSALWRSVSWSVELMPAEVRRSLSRCSVFAGAFSAESARAVAGEGAEEHLIALTQMHLLREEDGLYRPYEVVARFAERLLEGSGEERDAMLAHARWCAERSESVAGEGWSEYERLGADVELVEQRAQLPEAERALVTLGQRLFCRWQEIHDVRLPREELVARCERLAPVVDSEHTARIRFRWAMGMYGLRRIGEAVGPLEQLVSFTRENKLDDLLAIGLSHLADVAEGEFQYDRVEALLHEAIAAAKRAGDEKLELQLLIGPINATLIYKGRFDEAFEHYAQAKVVATELPHMAAVIDTRTAVLWLELGRPERVEELICSLPDKDTLRPNTRMVLHRIQAKIALQSHPRPIEVIAPLMTEPPPDGLLEVLWFAATVMDGTADPVTLERYISDLAANANRGMCELRLVLESAAATRGRIPSALDDRRFPRLSSCTDAQELLRQHMLGTLTPDEALSQLDSVRPLCWELFFVRRILQDLARERRRAAIGPDGAWFEREGARIEIDHPLMRRFLAALADDARQGGQGLGVEALFAAGWPGEPAARGAANRVRVALTKLRQTGVPVRFQHGLGWSLDVEGLRG